MGKLVGRTAQLPKTGRVLPEVSSGLEPGKKELAFSYDSVTLLPYTRYAVAHGKWSDKLSDTAKASVSLAARSPE